MTMSAPIRVDDVVHGVRVFEQITRLGEQRRYSPFNNSWVSVYRGIDQNRAVWLLCPRDPMGDAFTLLNEVRRWHARDLVELVRIEAQFCTIRAFPGMRLRAIVDATIEQGADFPPEVAISIALRTAAAAKKLRKAKAEPSDTMIGWDGSLWLVPTPADCATSANEMFWMGNEVFDRLVVNDSASMRQVLLGEPPPNAAGVVDELDRREHTGLAEALQKLVATSTVGASFERRCLRALEKLGPEPPPSLLGGVARSLFPDVYEKQRAVDEELAMLTK